MNNQAAFRFGGYNDFPPNWSAITEHELFRRGLMTYAPERQEFRQMFDRTGNQTKAISATLYFFFDGTGYAVEKDYENQRFNYYSFAACEHQYGVDVGKRPCEHIYICEKCGYKKVVDSSD